MHLGYSTINPHKLKPNPWNSNVVDRENFDKLKVSMEKLGCFKPVIVRRLSDDTLEILGGYHRNEAAKELGWEEVHYVSLGEIDDKRAREIALVDNTRYGTDDETKLQAILDEIGDLALLESIMPEELELPEISAEEPEIEETTPEEPAPDTHKVLKFRLEVEKAEEIEAILARIAYDNDFKFSDGFSDLGTALYHYMIVEKR